MLQIPIAKKRRSEEKPGLIGHLLIQQGFTELHMKVRTPSDYLSLELNIY